MSLPKLDSRLIKLYPLLEMVPLILFVLSRSHGYDISQRILIGGFSSLFVFGLFALRHIKSTPPYFGTNLFFLIVSLVLLLPFENLKDFWLGLREVGMFGVILLVAVGWHFLKSSGLMIPAPNESSPESKKYSGILLGIYALCPAISYYFRGDENWAGALPFMIIIFSEKILKYCQGRESTRKLRHAQY